MYYDINANSVVYKLLNTCTVHIEDCRLDMKCI